MSQTARVKTVINDLSALKQAIEKLGWSYNEAANKIDLIVKSGTENFNATRLADGKYEFSAGERYGANALFSKLNQMYAQVKLYKEINSRSGHGITGLSEATVTPDGRIVIEGEIDETLLVG
jgi:hypothetical protein